VTPYYTGHGAELYLGDCLEILPTLTITADLIVTDPPYGINFVSNRGIETGTRPQQRFSKIKGDENTDMGRSGVVAALRYLRPRRHFYVFGSWRASDFPDNAGGNTELIWDKTELGIGDLSVPWGAQHETIFFAVNTVSAAQRRQGDGNGAARLRRGTVLRYQRRIGKQNRSHPTEKPVSLLRELIESSSRQGELVLDPFVGIGSTCVAAAVEGRRSIGIEIEERYLEVAAKRPESVKVEYV